MKVSTVQEMFDFMQQLIQEGKGDWPIYFDTEAREYKYHMAKIGTGYILGPEMLGEEHKMVTLHEERS